MVRACIWPRDLWPKYFSSVKRRSEENERKTSAAKYKLKTKHRITVWFICIVAYAKFTVNRWTFIGITAHGFAFCCSWCFVANLIFWHCRFSWAFPLRNCIRCRRDRHERRRQFAVTSITFHLSLFRSLVVRWGGKSVAHNRAFASIIFRQHRFWTREEDKWKETQTGSLTWIQVVDDERENVMPQTKTIRFLG